MEESKLEFLKNILNTLEVTEIRYINQKSVLLNFAGGIRIYIDAISTGIDFSLEALTDEANEIIDDIETRKTIVDNKKEQ